MVFTTYNIKALKWNTAIAFILALPIPIIIHLLEANFHGQVLNCNYFIQIHTESIVVWVVDLIPFLTAVITFYFSLRRNQEKYLYEQEILQRKQFIERNVLFAKALGAGNYNYNLNSDVCDPLTKSLLIMRDNLQENKLRDDSLKWMNNGRAILVEILQGNTDLKQIASKLISSISNYVDAIQSSLYIMNENNTHLNGMAFYAYNSMRNISDEIQIGRGLLGQCAYEKIYIYRTEIPEDYCLITSGILGDRKPRSLLLVPLMNNNSCEGVMEFASLHSCFNPDQIQFIKDAGEMAGRSFFSYKISNHSRALLDEAQKLTQVLKENESILKENASEMKLTQEKLEFSNRQLEGKVAEVEQAQNRLNSLLENASEIITIYDEHLNIIFQSPSVKKILGYASDDLQGGRFYEKLNRAGELEFRKMFQRLKDFPGEVVVIYYYFNRSDGQQLFLETTGRNLLNDQSIKGFLLNTEDVTIRKRAEKEERMKSRMQSLSENSLDLIIRMSIMQQFFYINPVVEDYVGLSVKQMQDSYLDELEIPLVLKNYFLEAFKYLKEKPEKINKQIVLPIIMGEKIIKRILSIDAIPEYNENELETILFVGHDITEAKRIEEELKDKNKKVEDSINYARHIQISILPDMKLIRDYFPKSFILYKPKDVVSGDFPWFKVKGDIIYYAAIDCTGHGVPGAMLSFIGYFLLNSIVESGEMLSAADCCEKLHQEVRKTLKQEDEESETKDGMDIALVKIDLKSMKLEFAGAYRPLIILRSNNITEHKGTRKTIGSVPIAGKAEEQFENFVWNIERGDRIFFFSDGLPDQLGGPEKKKYSTVRIREVIIQNQFLSMPQFHEFFNKDLENWQGNYKQLDDILLIGLEF